MVLISIHPFGVRKLLLAILAFLCFSAFCFADPVLMVHRYAPASQRFGQDQQRYVPRKVEDRANVVSSPGPVGSDRSPGDESEFRLLEHGNTGVGVGPSSGFGTAMCDLRSAFLRPVLLPGRFYHSRRKTELGRA
jgi:hypothetical protein